MCDRHVSVGVVDEVESEEAGCVAVQCDLVMFANILDDAVYVCEGVAENEGVVHVNDDVGCFSRCNAIK